MQVTGAPVTKSTACLPPTSLNVTLWPLLVFPAYLTGLAAAAVAGSATTAQATTAMSVAVSFFMARSIPSLHAQIHWGFP